MVQDAQTPLDATPNTAVMTVGFVLHMLEYTRLVSTTMFPTPFEGLLSF